MRGLNTYETFKAVVDHAAASGHQIDAIVSTGDLVQDETRHGYQRFCAAMKTLNAPVHCLPGNHDSPEIMAELLNAPPFQYCGYAHYENWCLVMLNSAVRWDDFGRLEPNELDRLEQTLNDNAGRDIIIGLHHHPLATGSLWIDGLNLRNSDEFLALLENRSNVRCVVWGHVHQESDRVFSNMRMLSTPSTGLQFLPDSDVFRLDSRPPGYRWINLLPNGTIETEVVWLD